MNHQAFEDLLRDVPSRVQLAPREAWAVARRRHLRRRVLVVSLSVATTIGLVFGAQAFNRSNRAEPAPSPGSTFVRAEYVGETWKVLRSDGSSFEIDTHEHFAPLGLSPDGRWLSYTQGPES